jgi:pimeloyl-ACP methyl ester carboxylesterase
MTTTVTPASKFADVNGLRLHYLDWGNEGAPVIVCVHGLTSHAHALSGRRGARRSRAENRGRARSGGRAGAAARSAPRL